MATTSIMTGLTSLVANLPGKVNELLSSSRTASSLSSSTCSQVEEEVEKLCRLVKWIQALVDDAEEREIRDKSIKLWLDDLRDVAYDAEDVAEEFQNEFKWYQPVHQEGKNDQDSHQVSVSPFPQQMIAKIRGVNARFDEIYNRRRALKLSKSDGKRRKKQKFAERPATSSLLGDSVVYGRVGDKANVLDMVLPSQSQEHGGTKNVSVVSIIGMGGVGKTTLAQLVYNDDRVASDFEVRTWVCVSDCLDVAKLTKEILEAVTGETVGVRGFNLLQERLHKSLEGKRFLVVLDDLWNENVGQWEALWKPLGSGAAGSKVLITTRSEEVSRISGSIRTHRLDGLLKGDCWSLFAQCAFGGRNPHDHPNLVSIGKKIVQKCGGLPLAVRTLGGLLFNESDEDEWNAILTSDLWELPEEKNDILPALRLSYHYLASPIKPCFAFCAVFPKDYEFSLDKLVSFWMALGYIRPTRGRCMEDIGRKYVEDLRRRSFLQEYDRHRGFKMHDLIHDLALSVWGSECCTLGYGKLFNDASRKVRHLLLDCKEDVTVSLSCAGSIDKFQYLRTFYVMGNFAMDIPDDMFRRMKHLRVLCLLDTPIRELPDSLGSLRHLRYLGICGRALRRLPETLGNLLNLQILTDGGAHSLKELPRGIGRLTQLRTIPRFVVGGGVHAAGIEELRHLNDLQGDLRIDVRRLNNRVNGEPNILIHKEGLKILWLDFTYMKGTCEDESSQAAMMLLQEQLLEFIQPHTNIGEVKIRNYSGSRFPKWMESPSYWRLREIILWKCNYCKSLPAFGQLPSLEFVYLRSMHGLTSVGREFLGEKAPVFPSLEKLIFVDLPQLEGTLLIGTEEGGAFLRLRELHLYGCRKLMHVKLRHLTSLRVIKTNACPELSMLDFCQVSISPSGLEQAGATHTHIPLVHTMELLDCPKLSFPLAEHQRLPPRLRVFIPFACPLLMEWVAIHEHKLVGVPGLYTHHSQPRKHPHLALCNVKDVEEATVARLSTTHEAMEELELKWDVQQHQFLSTPGEAEQVLQILSPPEYPPLKVLLIQGYRGQHFPDWVGKPSFLPFLVKMTLSVCVGAEHLPPLGRLPSLRKLHISNMYRVEHMGHEFFAEGETYAAFPSLRLLTIDNCPKLATLQVPSFLPSISSSNSTLSMKNPLPLLKVLHIRDCAKLVSLVGMHQMFSLRFLTLARCPALHFSQEVQLSSRLQFVSIQGSSQLPMCFKAHQISNLRVLWVNGNRAISGTDGTSCDEIFNSMKEMIDGDCYSAAEETSPQITDR